jgi:Xaa-Pro aminopeptidase
MRWLAGFAPHPDERLCLRLVSPERAGFVMPALNAAEARQHSDLPFWDWDDADGPAAALAAALAAIAPRPPTLALDEAMRADFALALVDALPQARRSFTAATVGALRAVKESEEIAALRANARIADVAQTAVRAALVAGATEAELADLARAAFLDAGARPIFALVAAGANGAFPHHSSGATRVAPGAPVVVDLGGTKDGYVSDITRMAVIGDPPAGYAEVHAVVEAAVTAALAAIRPGVPLSAVDAAARGVITEAGFGPYFTHRTGHGVGQEIHEPPYVTASNPQLIEAGMAFTVEPGIYLPDRFGIRLEEVVVVTDGGAAVLSQLPRALHVA